MAGHAGGLQAGPLALMLNAEISSVITAMRANAKWAVVPKYMVGGREACCGAGAPHWECQSLGKRA